MHRSEPRTTDASTTSTSRRRGEPSRGEPTTRPSDHFVYRRKEGRHITLVTGRGEPIQIAVCGLCSALVPVDDDGELQHLLAHDAEVIGCDEPSGGDCVPGPSLDR